jgi:hypothetical protein
MKEHRKKRLNSNFQPNRTNGEQISAKTVFSPQILPNLTTKFFLWQPDREHWSHMKEQLFLHLRSKFRANRTNGSNFSAKKPNFATLTYHNFGHQKKFFFLILPRPNQVLQTTCPNRSLCITNSFQSRFEGKYPQATKLWTKKIFFRHDGAKFSKNFKYFAKLFLKRFKLLSNAIQCPNLDTCQFYDQKIFFPSRRGKVLQKLQVLCQTVSEGFQTALECYTVPQP